MPHLTPLERRWRELAPPRTVPSAVALYERVRLWSSGNLPFVDLPYDPRREQHWAYAAQVAGFASHLPHGGRTILDFGPGDGWPALPLAAALPHAQVIGVDPSPRRVRVCRVNAIRLRLPNASFVAAQGEALPVSAASVDLVTASLSLEECADPDAALREVARILRPGGILRVVFQEWRLAAQEVETLALAEGVGCLLLAYTRRIQEPARERRYLMALPRGGAAAEAHRETLIALADAPRAYGDALLEADSPLGIEAVERLAPFATASLVTDLARWTRGSLVDALHRARFSDAHATAHSGDLARRIARAEIAHGQPSMERFLEVTRTTGALAGWLPPQAGAAMVTAVR